MPKQAPSVGRILGMVVFTMSCFGILLFLWISFGGPVPLKPKGYEFTVNFPEATTLAQEADVRIAGVNVGKVVRMKLDKGGARTTVTIDINKGFAPIPKDSKAILRQKTLLGETYVELSPGTKKSGNMLPDDGQLANTQVEPTVQLDQIYDAFDPQTRKAFQQWVQQSAATINGGRAQDLNDALGNLQGFAEDGAGVLSVLNRQSADLHNFVKNTGVVFHALTQRQGQLRSLIVNSNDVFSATQSRDKALAQVFDILPTFEDESKATLARLQTFSENAHPLVNDLKPVADRLQPTVKDLSVLAPQLTTFFKTKLPPLIAAGKPNLPNGERFLRGASPLMDGLHTFFPEFNPILSFANYYQSVLADFLSIGGAATMYTGVNPPIDGVSLPTLSQFGIINERSVGLHTTIPTYDRGNAYLSPNAYSRATKTGAIEAFSCANTKTGGEVKQPDTSDKAPPCYVQPPLLFDNKQFPNLQTGVAPVKPPPGPYDGSKPARP
ncbi:MAG TPA: MlaD family protein [Thermoleophilaceae bacterium]|jgi:virulence factor Mce-like protein